MTGRRYDSAILPMRRYGDNEDMAVKRTIRRTARLPVMGAALVALAVALPTHAAAQGGTVAVIELVPLRAPSPGDTTTELPAPLDQVDLGESFVVEVWAQTDDSQGLSSVSTTISFDPAVAVVDGVTHSMLFSELLSGDVDNVAGLVVGLSGSHLSSCVDQVGVAPTWARVAFLDMRAAGAGSLAVESADTGLPALGTAICGVGDLSPSQVAYGTATLAVTAPPIPTVSQWGLVGMALLLLVVGTVAITQRTRSIDYGLGHSITASSRVRM